MKFVSNVDRANLTTTNNYIKPVDTSSCEVLTGFPDCF